MSGTESGMKQALSWQGALLRWAVVCWLLLATAGTLEGVWASLTGQPRTANEALGIVSFRPSAVEGAGWQRIDAIAPHGAAAAAGLHEGDSVRFEMLLGDRIGWRPGERVALMVARDGQRFPMVVVARSLPEQGSGTQILSGSMGLTDATVTLAIMGIDLISQFFCALLLVRGWRNRTAIMLAAILLSVFSIVPSIWPSHLAVQVLLFLALPLRPLITYLFPLFSMEISGGASSLRSARLVRATALIFYAAQIYASINNWFHFSGEGIAGLIIGIMALGNMLLSAGIVVRRYPGLDKRTRNRVKILMTAFFLFLLALFLGIFLNSLIVRANESGTTLVIALLVWGQLALSVFAIGLLTYAVLRQRLFDFGFVLNRTLVYGALSFILLAAFGLAEWGVDKLIPESWHKESALYSAGIALALFLSFHRLRDWVEHQVERLLFHSWHESEAALRRFVASAGHYDRTPDLCRAFAEALAHFGGGAPVALYLRGDEAGWRKETGTLADAGAQAADGDPALALMRAERAPVELMSAHSALPGVLALPMLDQGTLAGFVLLGGKADNAAYRPDEIELLGWAVRQTGLDLQALHARELEAKVADLGGRLAAALGENERLLGLLGGLPAKQRV